MIYSFPEGSFTIPAGLKESQRHGRVLNFILGSLLVAPAAQIVVSEGVAQVCAVTHDAPGLVCAVNRDLEDRAVDSVVRVVETFDLPLQPSGPVFNPTNS